MPNIRYLYHVVRASSPRELYWEFAARRSRDGKLKQPEFAAFARRVATEAAHLQRGLAADAFPLDTEPRLTTAVDWVLRAQRATPDAGVSLGYFPLEVNSGWYPSYPETTGYLITSLLAYAAQYQRDEIREAALSMAQWEIDVQMPSGAVQGGALAPPESQTHAAFNTGMVLDGWCSAYETSQDSRFLEAAAAAAGFLVADMNEHGYFRTSGAFVSQGETKTYNCLCGWSMLRLARLIGDKALGKAAVRAVDAALQRQRDNGWFANNCLGLSTAPLTHTIGYALQGVFEVGILAGRDDFVAAAERGLSNALRRQRPDGFLAGRFDERWNPAANFVCLTGSCQLAVIAYRFAELFGRGDLRRLADRALSFVAATQRLDGEDVNMVGAIAGSFPILGGYMTAGYPNWATKYFIDALLQRQRLSDAPP